MAERNYRYSKQHKDKDLADIQRETEDNFFSRDKDGNLVLDKDIHCRSIYVEGDSLYIGGIKVEAPIHDDNTGYWEYDRPNKKMKFTATASPITEEVQDITGAMVTGNTETMITVTYQDGDGTLDFEVGLSYGAMYTNTDIAVALTNQNEWYEIDAVQAWTTGKLSGCTFTDPKITVTNAGIYLIQYSTGASVDANTQEIEFGIMIDSTKTDSVAHGAAGMQAEGRNHRKFSNLNDVGAMSGTGIIQLAAGKTVSLAARNVTSASDTITVAHGNLTIVRLA